jgi:hypothetical protein
MDCHTVLDIVYESERDRPLTIPSQLKIWMHFLFCSKCTKELENIRRLEGIMKNDFFPSAPDFEDSIMECLNENNFKEEIITPVCFSFRLSIFIGFFLLFSLSSAFFGINFIEIANSEGLSFLLPIGLTIGMIVTCYGALFIGSHLEELSSRFGLR